jgi:hypothetical protein
MTCTLRLKDSQWPKMPIRRISPILTGAFVRLLREQIPKISPNSNITKTEPLACDLGARRRDSLQATRFLAPMAAMELA